jgi:NAD(P)-dependent dehydrogenase (short-subunit alcohol dehydrogenase family)
MLGTNAVAHAALAGLLLPELHRTPGARIVAQSSEAHRHGRLDLHDLQSTRARAIAAYNASKLALHVLAVELDRRSGIPTVVAQPGWVASELGRDVAASGSAGQRALLAVGNRLIGQTPEEGARAALRAALAPDVPGAATGRYVTPGGLARLRGTPRIADADPRVLDPRLGAGLGRWVEDVTGVALAAPAPAGGRA